MSISGDFLGPRAVIALHADSHPPIPYWTAETEHFSRAISLCDLPGKLGCRILLAESANLDSPAASAFESCGSLKDLNTHLRSSGPHQINLFGGGHG